MNQKMAKNILESHNLLTKQNINLIKVKLLNKKQLQRDLKYLLYIQKSNSTTTTISAHIFSLLLSTPSDNFGMVYLTVIKP